MNTIMKVGKWFTRSSSKKYSSIAPGVHRHHEEPVPHYDPVTTNESSNGNALREQQAGVRLESEMPAWQSILALYPDLTSAEGFDSEKLARFISDDNTNAGVDYLLSIFENDA